MFSKTCGLSDDLKQKPHAMSVSVKQLVNLFKKAINSPEQKIPGGSLESIRSYYKMIQQFASMAHIYQDLIPKKYDSSSILALAGFIIKLNFEEFLKIANNLPFMLDGVVMQDMTRSYSEADVDPSWEPTIAMLSKNLPDEIDLTDSKIGRAHV